MTSLSSIYLPYYADNMLRCFFFALLYGHVIDTGTHNTRDLAIEQHDNNDAMAKSRRTLSVLLLLDH